MRTETKVYPNNSDVCITITLDTEKNSVSLEMYNTELNEGFLVGTNDTEALSALEDAIMRAKWMLNENKGQRAKAAEVPYGSPPPQPLYESSPHPLFNSDD